MTDLLHKMYTQTIARAIFQPCLGMSITQKTNEVEKIRYVISTRNVIYYFIRLPVFRVSK